jgi:phosphatidylglycerophosphate synthase
MKFIVTTGVLREGRGRTGVLQGMTVDAYPGRLRLRAGKTELGRALAAQLCMIGILGWLEDPGLSTVGWVVGVGCVVMTDLLLWWGQVYFGSARLELADWITLARASLAAAIAALVTTSFSRPVTTWLVVALSVVALTLDFADGWVARRTGTSRRLGGYFDGEVDAFLMLVLSVDVARAAGVWVLAIGLMRYAFLLAWMGLGWMRRELPSRHWRKVVTAVQGIALTVAASAVLPETVVRITLLIALILLSESFGRDVWWLRVRRPRSVSAGAKAGPAGPAAEGKEPLDSRPRRLRKAFGVAMTVLAAVIVWIALVAPYQPRDFHLVDFFRVPLELIVVVGVALLLPKNPRRVFAIVAGVLLAVALVLKVINYETYTNFDRSFDPVGDITQINNAIFTLRATIGKSETHWLIKGTEFGIAVAIVVMVLAMLRVTWAATQDRRRVRHGLIGLSAVWVATWLFGLGFVTHTPIASSLTAGLVVNQAGAVVGDLDDRSAFATQIKRDPVAKTPTNRLLTALRGKDVLLVFVEAYGQVAVKGKSFSPSVDAALSQGDQRLAKAGFSSRSGYLTSPTFGGISWLAHSTLESGLWVNTQDRYNQLLKAKRLTLASAFKTAGWRTVDDVPSDNRPWPPGKRFYGFDTLYDRYQVGYHGPTFSYAAMPDQYIYSAFNRLELSKTHRKPLFAEIDTVSSHEPWTRVPREIPWSQVGNGSIYKTLSAVTATRGNARQEQASYGKSIVYSLNTLTSFVQHAHDKNLVMIVLGDHQPQPIVSGVQPNHDVPISIISHDPKVLQAAKVWGWNTGLKPAATAPVWRMSAFRDKFLSAFDTPAEPSRGSR